MMSDPVGIGFLSMGWGWQLDKEEMGGVGSENGRFSRIAIFLFALCFEALAGFAQSPHDDWMTLETANFRVTFPAEYSAWSHHAASLLEAVSEGVAEQVGYSPIVKIDVLVMNPMARANGSAWAVLNAPRMILWTTPPDPLSTLGYFVDPVQGLLVHEQAHLAHLLRASRNPVRSLMEAVIPVGPIAAKAPRWVVEGYATLLEGELTGAGRPFGDVRASVLRCWAQAGLLPSYGALDSGSKRWFGESMAYLVGSAYLEWLRDRTGEDSLRHLWARMSARQQRSFDVAFEGVFGDSPALLYARFRAEVTAEALAFEGRGVPAQEGELWQNLSWTTGGPDVSPDGQSVAVVLRSRDDPARLVVWSTGPNEEAEIARQKSIERLLARDPEDVAAVQSKPPARKALFELEARDRGGFYSPRWLEDGESILFSSFEPDARGDLHPDLFLWRPESGEKRRLTRSADLRQADPAPSGDWAVAVRHRFGLSQLVRVDLESGRAEALTEASMDRVYAHPRFSPDGSEIAFALHKEGRWRLERLDCKSGREQEIGLPADTTLVAHPEWIDEGSLRVTLGRQGSIEIYELDLDHPWYARRLTQSRGAALAHSSSPDQGELFYLSLETHGLDLRRLDLKTLQTLPDIDDRALGRPSMERPPAPMEVIDLDPARGYGFGRQEWMLLAGGVFGPSARSLEVGGRLGDLVGRLDSILVGALGQKGGAQGMAFASSWRGWPVQVSTHIYGMIERPSEQPTTVPGLGETLDGDRRGIEIAASWDRHWRDTDLDVRGLGHVGRFEKETDSVSLDQSLVYADARLAHRRSLSGWIYGYSLRGGMARGRTGEDSWSSIHSHVDLSAGLKKHHLVFTWKLSSTEGIESAVDRIVVGGMPSSVTPRSLEVHRMSSPALPLGILIGEHYEGLRWVLKTDLMPIEPFYERHRVWDDGVSRGEWLDLVGLEVRTRSEPVPLLRLPALDLALGAAWLLETPFEELDNEIEWWFSLTYRP